MFNRTKQHALSAAPGSPDASAPQKESRNPQAAAGSIGRSSRVLAALALALSLAVQPALASAAAPKMAVILDDQSRSFFPIRFLNGFDGTSMDYDAAAKRITVVKGDKKLVLTTGSTTALVNGEPVVLTSAPFAEQGTTYVPIQFITQQLGVSLEWDRNASSITITSGELSSTLPYVQGIRALTASKPVDSTVRTFKVGSRTFKTNVVTVSLLHPKVHVDVALAHGTVGKVQELRSIAAQNKAVVAINGTFFEAYTSADYKMPYGHLASGGQVLMDRSGDKKATFTYDENQLARIIPGLEFRSQFYAGQIEGALQAGPRLLVDGKVAIDAKQEGFQDPKILTGGGARSALGITKDHKLILLTTGGATIPQLAEIMKQAGAHQAMNLDGGASSGLYYNGKYLTTPGRQISNAIIVTLE